MRTVPARTRCGRILSLINFRCSGLSCASSLCAMSAPCIRAAVPGLQGRLGASAESQSAESQSVVRLVSGLCRHARRNWKSARRLGALSRPNSDMSRASGRTHGRTSGRAMPEEALPARSEPVAKRGKQEGGGAEGRVNACWTVVCGRVRVCGTGGVDGWPCACCLTSCPQAGGGWRGVLFREAEFSIDAGVALAVGTRREECGSGAGDVYLLLIGRDEVE
eukprot:scaffold138325_cov32-Tisochrysis_lutea.AAC.3